MNKWVGFHTLKEDKGILLRGSIGVIFLWFGVVKFFPGISPADELVSNTICTLVFHVISPPTCVIMLGVVETLIGLMLIIGKFLKPALWVLLFHMTGTFLTFFIFPDAMFKKFPVVLSIQGQYVMKNIIIIAASITLYYFMEFSETSKKVKKTR